MDARYQADTMIADSKREYQMRSAEFSQEINTKKAEAELAYQLQVISMFLYFWRWEKSGIYSSEIWKL